MTRTAAQLRVRLAAHPSSGRALITVENHGLGTAFHPTLLVGSTGGAMRGELLDGVFPARTGLTLCTELEVDEVTELAVGWQDAAGRWAAHDRDGLHLTDGPLDHLGERSVAALELGGEQVVALIAPAAPSVLI